MGARAWTLIGAISIGVGAVFAAIAVWLILLASYPCISTELATSCSPPPGYYVFADFSLAVGAALVAWGLVILVPVLFRIRKLRRKGQAV